MPELPEVETIVRELKPEVQGRVFKSVESASFKGLKMIIGSRILDVVRRGKYIVFILDGDLRMAIHLRMTGRLMWHEEAARAKFTRAVFTFDDGRKLYFSDVRKFGKIMVGPEKKYAAGTGMVKLGLEPLEMSLEDFTLLMDERKGILKNTLLRQDLIAGLGNIYADEICFRAGVHPSSRIEKLGIVRIKKLYSAVQYCLNEGIKHCGVSVSDFVGTRGDLGRHQHYLKVYGRKGLPCYSCKTLISKTVAAGRGTYYCAKCQSLLK
jgi:formamidopyrimidine-DNA glycosylase